MAETLLSPGVLARETDQSFIQGQPVQAGAAIVGPAAKGPVGIPTLVTSPSEYDAVFGTTTQSGSRDYSYLTRKSAYNYFEQGESLLVTRVQYSGSSDLNGWGGATSTTITAQTGSITNPFKLKTISQGTAMNSVGPEGDNNKLASGSRENLRWKYKM